MMKYDQWHILRNELRKSPEEILAQDKSFDIGKYNTKIQDDILFNFFEECRLIIRTERIENCLITFSDLIKKIIIIRQVQFEIKYTEKDEVIIYKPNGININESNELSYQILRIKNKLFDNSISYLHDLIKDIKLGTFEINNLSKHSRPLRKTCDFSGFNTKLKSEDIKDLYETFIDVGLMPNDTDQGDFIRIFTGKGSEKKITWLGTNQELSYLIKNIDGKSIEPLKKNIWNVTIRCFKTESGDDFVKEQLRHSGDPKNKERINPVIDFLKKYSK